MEKQFSCGKTVSVGVLPLPQAYILLQNCVQPPRIPPVVGGGKIRIFHTPVENHVENVEKSVENRGKPVYSVSRQ